MRTKYAIKSQEEGRGKWTTERFTTLAAASQYIQDRWQGIEYKDGIDGFHTDCSSYVLVGFTFKDIGSVIMPKGYYENESDRYWDRSFEFFQFDSSDKKVEPAKEEVEEGEFHP